MCLVPVIRPQGAKIAQPRVYPGLAENKRFALKLEMRTGSAELIRSGTGETKGSEENLNRR
jgi:hypothetical protein